MNMTQDKRQGKGKEEIRDAGKLRGAMSLFRVQMERYSEEKKILLISGAKAILHYSTAFLELDIGGEYLIVRGSSILCRTFVSGNIEIIGKIDEIDVSGVYRFPKEETVCS